MTASDSSSADCSIIIDQTFAAPVTKVWDAWTIPSQIESWWGPEGFGARVEKQDFRVGGTWRYIMLAPDGAEYPSSGAFLAIDPLKTFVTTDNWDHDAEYPVHQDDLPQDIITTVTFEDLGESTRVIITMTHPSAEEKQKHVNMGVVTGYQSQLRCLISFLGQR